MIIGGNKRRTPKYNQKPKTTNQYKILDFYYNVEACQSE
jgi:hypothetical protein